ncbi:MAG: hypothetical protein MJ158_00185 [Alphaproteobacteria bacterium]|nr:hypothetical protein [Alphaproteobacteria bacterium]
MKLRYITCSDPREHNSVKSILDLATLPHVEIAVQCHPSKMSDGMPRNIWFTELLKQAKQLWHTNLAIHINQEWADSICTKGIIPQPLLEWMQIEKTHNHPLIQRVQLNMSKTTAENINPQKLAEIIKQFSHQEFILQYNDKTKQAVSKLNKTGCKFSLLFDASGGNGIQPTTWKKPVYKKHLQGYSGGLSPENVIQNLDKIAKVVPKDASIWIDAEGKLKSQNLFDEKPVFDADKAKRYIQRAKLWQLAR